MSGIVNSAGSKSGVIGTTEIDYEEGEYTVTVTGTSGGNFVVNSTNDIFRYTKIGRLVHVQGLIIIDSDNSSGGYIRISLPFVIGTATGLGGRSYPSCVLYDHGGTIAGDTCIELVGGNTYGLLLEVPDSGVRNYLNETDVDGAWGIGLDLCYTV